MSVAPTQPPLPALPERRPRRRFLFWVFLVVLTLMAVPIGAVAYCGNELDQAQRLQSQAKYSDALQRYQAVNRIAGNVLARPLLKGTADRARAGAAQTEFDWGTQELSNGNFPLAEQQFTALVHSGLSTWQVRGNEALADLFLAWANDLVKDQKFDSAIATYRRIKDSDRTGRLQAQTAQALATAYAAYAAWFRQAKPPDFPSAITWYQNLVKEFPDSPEAKQATATLLPQTLYDAALAYVDQQRFDQARDAMGQIVKNYSSSRLAAKASAALAASQPVTGRLLQPDSSTPVTNRLIRISTKWKIVSPHTYDDSDGQYFSTTTDNSGNFSLLMPPGQNYLITWWDPSRQNFVTTFMGDDAPVNLVTVQPLQPSRISVTIA